MKTETERKITVGDVFRSRDRRDPNRHVRVQAIDRGVWAICEPAPDPAGQQDPSPLIGARTTQRRAASTRIALAHLNSYRWEYVPPTAPNTTESA